MTQRQTSFKYKHPQISDGLDENRDAPSTEDWKSDCSHLCEALTVSWPAMSAWGKIYSHWTSHDGHMSVIMLEQLSAQLWERGTTEQYVKLS